MFDLDRRRFAAAVLAAVAVPRDVRAQGLDVDDLLAMEGLGRRAISPDGRWLLFEQRGPYASAARFDFDRLNDLMRTRIRCVELFGAGPPRDLTPRGGPYGFALGEIAPGGAQALIYRVSPDGFECGLATFATGAVRWTGVFGDWLDVGRTAQWRSARELLVIATPPGRPPMLARHLRPQAPMPDRWRASAEGHAAFTVVGSGAFGDLSPHDPPRSLVSLTADGRVRSILAQGDFADLEISPDGRHVALMVAGANLPLDAAHQVQGEYGIALRTRRLRVLDLETGDDRSPPLDLDLIGQPLAWSPSGRRLLVFGRTPGGPWSEGRLRRLDIRSGRIDDPAPAGLAPVVLSRPELVRAGWMGETPLVYARAGSATRADWWRLGAHPTALTAALATVPLDGLAADQRGLSMVADGRLLRLDTAGGVRPLCGPVAQTMPFREGLLPRVGWTFITRVTAVAMAPQPAVVTLDGDRLYRQPLPHGADLLAHRPDQGALVRLQADGADTLAWVSPTGDQRRLVSLNAHLARCSPPRVRAVPHRGPEDQSLVSWLVLPDGPATEPPPLVVWPYPGLVFSPPPAVLSLGSPGLEPVLLLAARGYAVLMPSLPDPRSGAAPGVGLADRILAIIAAAQGIPGLQTTFDPQRLGIWGHSFGGYAALAVIGQSDRFRAAVSMAGISNLFSKWAEFGPMRRVWPEDGLYTPGWTEDLQPAMGGPPWTDPARYVAGSPMFGLGECKTPLLLFHGDQDAIPLAQSEAAFAALQRQNRDAVLVTYWGEGHVVRSPGNMRDYYGRSLDWFDLHLRTRATREGS